jgi:molecular chaperone GrpE
MSHKHQHTHDHNCNHEHHDHEHDHAEEQPDGSQEGLEDLSAEELLDQLQKMSKEHDLMRNQMLGAQAELQNVRKRAERDIEQAHKYGTKKLLQDFFPVLDSLVKANEGIDAHDPKVKAMAEGVDLTVKILSDVLIKNGVVLIDPAVGAPFNPETMEAVSMVAHPGVASNSVIQVLQKGYILNDRVVRAAMVMVAS